MEFAWIDTAEGITLVVENGYVRGATPLELEMRADLRTLATFVRFVLMDTAPPASVAAVLARHGGKDAAG